MGQEVVDGGAQQHGADQRAQQGLPGQAHSGAEPALALHPHGGAGRSHREGDLHRHREQHVPAKKQHGQRARAKDQRSADEEDGHHGHDHHGAFVGAANGIGGTTGQVAQRARLTASTGAAPGQGLRPAAAKIARGATAPKVPAARARQGHLAAAGGAVAAGPGNIGQLYTAIARRPIPPHQPRRPGAQHQQIADVAHRQRDQVPQRQRIHAQHHLQVRGGPHQQQREAADQQPMPAQAVALLQGARHRAVVRHAHRAPGGAAFFLGARGVAAGWGHGRSALRAVANRRRHFTPVCGHPARSLCPLRELLREPQGTERAGGLQATPSTTTGTRWARAHISS